MTQHSTQTSDRPMVGPAMPTHGFDGLPEHLHVVSLGDGDYFLLCEEHGPASLIDSLDATLRAECPGCKAARELAWLRLRNRLRLA